MGREYGREGVWKGMGYGKGEGMKRGRGIVGGGGIVREVGGVWWYREGVKGRGMCMDQSLRAKMPNILTWI